MSVEVAVERLMKNHPRGFDLSLGRVTDLLGKLGNPQLSIPPAFHIAGTNGKGSTAAFLRSILEAAGHSVHVHTSPHLVRWNERYRIGNKAQGKGSLVSDAVLEDAILRVEAANGGRPITVFEIMSAVAFLLFSEHEADFSVIEVGLGGRFDATNVLRNPISCLITSVGLDHQAYLGDTLKAIAFEKAGIIKDGAPVIIGRQAEEARIEIERVAAQRSSPCIVAGQDFDFYEQAGRFVYQDSSGLIDLPLPRLAGEHQLANAATAITAIRTAIPGMSNSAVERGLLAVSWPGRFERLKPGNLISQLPELARGNLDIWIDGGHNPHAGKALAAALAGLEERTSMPLILVAGMLTTKDPAGFFDAFSGLAREVLTVPVPDTDTGFEPAELANAASAAGLPARAFSSLKSAFSAIGERYGDAPARVMICGSLYLIGDVLKENGTFPV